MKFTQRNIEKKSGDYKFAIFGAWVCYNPFWFYQDILENKAQF